MDDVKRYVELLKTLPEPEYSGEDRTCISCASGNPCREYYSHLVDAMRHEISSSLGEESSKFSILTWLLELSDGPNSARKEDPLPAPPGLLEFASKYNYSDEAVIILSRAWHNYEGRGKRPTTVGEWEKLMTVVAMLHGYP